MKEIKRELSARTGGGLHGKLLWGRGVGAFGEDLP